MKYKKFIYILVILLLALSLRGIYLFQTKNNPLFSPVNNGLDPSLYHKRAVMITHGAVYSLDFVYGMPLYPYFLALIYHAFGESVFLVRLIQMALGVINCLLIYLIAKRLFNQRTAYIALLLSATYGMFIFYEGMLLSSCLTIMFSCLSILALFWIENKPSWAKWLWLGFLLGLASLDRAGMLLFVPLILLWFAFRPDQTLKQRFIKLFVLCVAILLVIAPITVRNYRLAKDFIPLTAHGGINFYIGNNPQADGSFKPPPSLHTSLAGLIADSTREAQRRTGREMKPSEVSGFWFNRGIQFIRTQPKAYFKLLGRKLALLLNSYEIFDVVDYSFFRKEFPTVLNLPLPDLKLILPLALLGIGLSLKHWRQCVLVYLFMLSFSISILAYFVHARYRLPLVAFWIIFAAYSIDWWGIKLQQKKFPAVLLSLPALALLAVFSNLDLVQQNYLSQYNNLGVAYKEVAKYDLAIQAYQQALEIAPDSAQIHSNLGNLYNATGKYTQAAEEFKQAIALDPDLAEAHSNLGIIYSKSGENDLAIESYKKAIALRPDLVTTRFNLGVIYYQNQQLDLAVATFEEVLKIDPEHISALNNLGAVYFQQQNFSQARSQWQKLLKIKPDFLPAKQNLRKLRELGY